MKGFLRKSYVSVCSAALGSLLFAAELSAATRSVPGESGGDWRWLRFLAKFVRVVLDELRPPNG